MDIKKSLCAKHSDFQFSLLFVNYSATTESVATVSATAATVSATTVSSTTTAEESAASEFAFWLPPQDAKDTATNATNKNTNFFIFFAFLICNT